MDLWKRLAELANIISAAIAVYLLFRPAGQPLVNHAPTHAPDNLPLVILCLSVLSASVLNFVAMRRRSNLPIGQSNAAAAGVHQSSNFGTESVLADGRVVISCKPEDFHELYNTHTKEQINRLFRGKWIKMTGTLSDNRGGVIDLKASSPMVRLEFAKGWEEQLSVLHPDSTITIRGKFEDADVLRISLAECELL